jgi:ADP-heptose:LPS heptosyltransferase
VKLLDPINKLLFSIRKKNSDNILGKVLVVSNTGFGDTLLSSPAIKTLRKSFLNQKIIFLINKKYSPLFIKYKYVDSIWKYSGSYTNLFILILRCRVNNIHTIILLHSNSPEDIFLSLLSGAKNILKWTDNVNHPYKRLFLNEIIKKEQHNIEKKIDLIRFFNPNIIDTTMSISDNFYEKNLIDNFTTKKKIIGIQLGAQDVYKIWPVENFIKLCLYLVSKNYFLFFFGATKLEYKMMVKIEEVLVSSSICNLVCKTKISELPAILKQLTLLITNDTGILHLSIAMKVNSLSLFGPTSSKEFGAYQDIELHHSIQKNGFFVNDKPKKQRNQDGMKLITVDEVISKIEEII